MEVLISLPQKAEAPGGASQPKVETSGGLQIYYGKIKHPGPSFKNNVDLKHVIGSSHLRLHLYHEARQPLRRPPASALRPFPSVALSSG